MGHCCGPLADSGEVPVNFLVSRKPKRHGYHIRTSGLGVVLQYCGTEASKHNTRVQHSVSMEPEALFVCPKRGGDSKLSRTSLENCKGAGNLSKT